MIIGIDLGTTTSAVAVTGPDGVRAIGAEPVVPSLITYGGGEIAVGARAAELAADHPESSFRGIKRMLGRKVDSAGVLRLARGAPFSIAAAPNRDAWVKVAGRPWRPWPRPVGRSIRGRSSLDDAGLHFPFSLSTFSVVS